MATTFSRSVHRTVAAIRAVARTAHHLALALIVELLAYVAHLPIAVHAALAIVMLIADRLLTARRR
jgi:succinate dehydrogenase/fumarate reductase cytochrome b subunit